MRICICKNCGVIFKWSWAYPNCPVCDSEGQYDRDTVKIETKTK